MQDYISDWYIPMDFGNDLPDEEPDGEDNYNYEYCQDHLFTHTHIR